MERFQNYFEDFAIRGRQDVIVDMKNSTLLKSKDFDKPFKDESTSRKENALSWTKSSKGENEMEFIKTVVQREQINLQLQEMQQPNREMKSSSETLPIIASYLNERDDRESYNSPRDRVSSSSVASTTVLSKDSTRGTTYDGVGNKSIPKKIPGQISNLQHSDTQKKTCLSPEEFSNTKSEVQSPSSFKTRVEDTRASPVFNRRKRESGRSPLRHKGGWERSPSPSRRRDSSPSYRERAMYSSSRDKRKGRRDSGSRNRYRRDDSYSPRRRHRSSRSSSSRRERSYSSRERSLSPRRERSLSPRRERSLSPRRESGITRRGPGRSLHSPCRGNLTASHEDSWKPTSPNYSVQPQQYDAMPPPTSTVYTSVGYDVSATLPSYTTASQQYPNYQTPQQYGYNYYQAPPMQYSGEYAQHSGWSEGNAIYSDMSQPATTGQQLIPPSGSSASTATQNEAANDRKSEEAKKEAIKNEVLQQKQTLIKQREEYLKKSVIISRELRLLRKQETELLEENSKDNDRILKENNKLQAEIQTKLKAINNVIDMLTGIIGDGLELPDESLTDTDIKEIPDTKKKRPITPEETPKIPSPDPPSPLTKPSNKKEEEKEEEEEKCEPIKPEKTVEVEPVFNFVHYDPEIHWCRVCDFFPATAKEYLNHMHDMDHIKKTLERKVMETPWHQTQENKEVTYHENAPTKRIPIKGIDFFVPVRGWYCKLCNVWIGDLHCASLHLKSPLHSDNYANFTKENPHWETDWLADREKALQSRSNITQTLKVESKDHVAVTEDSLITGKPDKTIKDANLKEAKVKLDKTKKKTKSKSKRNASPPSKEQMKESKKRKRRKRKGKRQKDSSESCLSSSTSSSSSNSSNEDANDDTVNDNMKSIRVVMRNRPKKTIVEPPAESAVPHDNASRMKQDIIEDKDKEKEMDERERKKKMGQTNQVNTGDDKLFKEWMVSKTVVTNGDKQLLNTIKDRLKLKQEAGKERDKERRSDNIEKNYYNDRKNMKKSRKDTSPTTSWRRGKEEDKHWESSRFDRFERSSASEKLNRDSRREHTGFREARMKEDDGKFFGRKSPVEKKTFQKFCDKREVEPTPETKLEKLTQSTANLTKKPSCSNTPTLMSISKPKLPFIGRMPILKANAKKKEDKSIAKIQEIKNEGKKWLPQTLSNIENKVIPKFKIIEKTDTKERTGMVTSVHQTNKVFNMSAAPCYQESVRPSVEMFDKAPKLTFQQLPIFCNSNAEISKPEDTPSGTEVLDMEIDDDSLNSEIISRDVDQPSNQNLMENLEDHQKKTLCDIPLPKDFQEALNIIFPGQKGKEDDQCVSKPLTPMNITQSMENQWHQSNQQHAPMMQGPTMPPGSSHPIQYGGHMMAPAMMGPPRMHVPPDIHRSPNMQGMQGSPSRPPGMYGAPAMMRMNGPYRMHGAPPCIMRPRMHAPLGPPEKNELQHSSESDMSNFSLSPPKLQKFGSGDAMGDDDLAMLGIDVGDMAAQSF